MIHRITRTIGDKEITLETGLLGKLAAGSVVASCGGTKVFAAVTYNPELKPDQDFFPLSVDYREMTYASGKIPGSFFRRESRPSEREILVSRLIDRPLRPQFPDGFLNDVSIYPLVISFDKDNESDVLAQVASAAALAISEIPVTRTIGSVRVGYIDGQFICNPLKSQMEQSTIDLIISGSREGICMVEAGCSQIDETTILEAIEFGHLRIKETIALIEELVAVAGKPKLPVTAPVKPEWYDAMKAHFEPMILAAGQTPIKNERLAALASLAKQALVEFVSEEKGITAKQVAKYYHEIEYEVLRSMTLNGKRCDGRAFDQVRPISIELGYLPCAHGSAVFTRGETQALATCTLGTSDDEMLIDGIIETHNEDFILHYNFPPYATGESSFLRGPKRREIGHGALARRALKAVVPNEADFPYTMRIVSDIMESNGSSSMASVCGGCLAMMDAGVPITAPVAGIAMGLLQGEGRFVVLTDILGDEDHFGEMDFKVAGTRDGVTALQMDIKVPGIPTEVMRQALDQAKAGRLHILDRMFEVIETPRPNLSPNAPRIVQIKIPVDRIGKVIGPGGKMIRAIQEETGVRIDIEDDGTVNIAAVGDDKINAARKRIEDLTMVAEIGKIYDGTVVSLRDFGAFVRIGGDLEGLCHVSELTDGFIRDIYSFVRPGDTFRVKVISIEDDKVRLSRKQAIAEEGTVDSMAEQVKLQPPGENRPPRPADPRRNDRGGRDSRGDRGGRDRGRDRH